MVTLMSEQSGRGESEDRSRSGQSRDADRPGAGQSQQPGRRQPGADMLSDLQRDLQRWLIRSSARNVRSQVEDQVRRTLGGQRPDKGDVWDTATTEIPPEVGEAPECQWCPICRAARRMRENRPGLAGQLSGAGDTVAAAVQDAVRTFDTFLSRAAGGSAPDSAPGGAPASSPEAGPGTSPAEDRAPGEPDLGGADAAGRPDSLAGEHGPVGWKPGDRLATAGAAVADPWAAVTEPGEPAGGGTSAAGASGGGTNDSGSTGSPTSGGPDGRGHGPSDRS
jgi:hypothetical protein